MVSARYTITTPRTFGKICRLRICPCPAPRTRLASTKARCRSDSTCPRTIRAIVSHETAPSPANRNSSRASFPHSGDATCASQILQPAFQRRDQHDHKNNGRQRIQHIHEAHHHTVPAPAQITRHGAPQHADDQADHRAHGARPSATPAPRRACAKTNRAHARPCRTSAARPAARNCPSESASGLWVSAKRFARRAEMAGDCQQPPASRLPGSKAARNQARAPPAGFV